MIDDLFHSSRKPPKSFAFDHCFNSYLEPSDHNFAGQEKVFHSLGTDILDNAFEGYNACIFAYGQTGEGTQTAAHVGNGNFNLLSGAKRGIESFGEMGWPKEGLGAPPLSQMETNCTLSLSATGSGKSYSMMGSQDSQGLIPRLCNGLFERIADKNVDSAEDGSWHSKVEVSYMEIYNEKVHDLLNPTMTSGRQGLKVREHSVLGPYVDGLSQLAVISYQVRIRLTSDRQTNAKGFRYFALAGNRGSDDRGQQEPNGGLDQHE